MSLDLETRDLVIVGAGAAGLMAAITASNPPSPREGAGGWAAGLGARLRTSRPSHRILALDGAKTLGAKILVAGGGRCNVTHHAVDEHQYAGSTPPAIRKVLRRFDVPDTIAFFKALDVDLKREDTGKLFPTSDSARTVLNALLRAASGAELHHPWRVGRVEHIPTSPESPFLIHHTDAAIAPIAARRLILATGGKALPLSGSDGLGYSFATALGHSITPRTFPALAPLVLQKGHWVTTLSGISASVTLDLRSGTNKRLKSFTNALLCTHFGISGPAAMDMSRHLTAARFEDPAAHLTVNWLPGETRESIDAALLALGKSAPSRFLRQRGLPERLADALCAAVGVDPAAATLSRDARRALAAAISECMLPVTADRGYTYAEATAGGVPLSEVHLDTMESRICSGLHLCGEILDVDGRIGGFNFQWAWASGHLAGRGAALAS